MAFPENRVANISMKAKNCFLGFELSLEKLINWLIQMYSIYLCGCVCFLLLSFMAKVDSVLYFKLSGRFWKQKNCRSFARKNVLAAVQAKWLNQFSWIFHRSWKNPIDFEPDPKKREMGSQLTTILRKDRHFFLNTKKIIQNQHNYIINKTKTI